MLLPSTPRPLLRVARVQTWIKALYERSSKCPAVWLLQGSGAKDPAAFAAAIAKARSVCDAGLALGFDMNTVDIGGGYVSCAAPGAHVDRRQDVAAGEVGHHLTCLVMAAFCSFLSYTVSGRLAGQARIRCKTICSNIRILPG